MGTLLSFLFFTLLVGAITYWRTHRENLNSREGYFLGGNSLNGWVIAGSLLLTNLSAANFTGMTAHVYGTNLAPIAWTVTVIPPLLFFAGVLLPAFLRRGFATVPEFLETRYGSSTRRIVTGLFLFCYIFGGMPAALYGGSIAIMHLFDVPTVFGINETQSVWLLVVVLGSIGGVYALFGGLRGVAVSDSLNGIGLLAGGVLVFIFGIVAVGQGSFGAGTRTVFFTQTHKLDAVGDINDLVPFAVLFTGMVLHNTFYWCTNQFIVQRTFGARSLREGQKGVVIAGFFKILNIFYIAIPGVIAFHLYGPDQFANNDWVYPTLVRDIMPGVFVGFFAAVIFGAVLSTYNSVLNSSVTLFAVDLYKPIWGRHLTDAQVITRSKWVGLFLVVFTILVAPMIMKFPHGIFLYMIKTEVLFGSPITLVLLIGYFSRTVSARAANVTLVSHLFWLSLFQFVIPIDLHFMHVMALLFAIHVGLVFALSRVWPHASPVISAPPTGNVDLTPWPHFRTVGMAALLCMIGTYVVFSPWGLVQDAPAKVMEYGWMSAGILLSALLFGIPWWLARQGRRNAS